MGKISNKDLIGLILNNLLSRLFDKLDDKLTSVDKLYTLVVIGENDYYSRQCDSIKEAIEIVGNKRFLKTKKVLIIYNPTNKFINL